LSIPYLSNNASIANVSSMYGLVAPDFDAYENCPQFLNPPHYGAAKAGVIQLSKYYASFLGKKGIRVNAVSPGPFPSSEVQKNDNFMKELSKRTLLNRIGLPHELAGVFVFLMSESSRFITGQNFVVDGGWTVR
ncbi:MAG: NAD(P)-dependent dehydrogenase (short-subunit alcohol dehydrogenase family), partial [Sediminicola sp.]